MLIQKRVLKTAIVPVEGGVKRIFLAGHKVAQQRYGSNTGDIIPAERRGCFPVMCGRTLAMRWICAVYGTSAIGAIAHGLQVLAPLPGPDQGICFNGRGLHCLASRGIPAALRRCGESGNCSQTGYEQICADFNW